MAATLALIIETRSAPAHQYPGPAEEDATLQGDHSPQALPTLHRRHAEGPTWTQALPLDGSHPAFTMRLDVGPTGEIYACGGDRYEYVPAKLWLGRFEPDGDPAWSTTYEFEDLAGCEGIRAAGQSVLVAGNDSEDSRGFLIRARASTGELIQSIELRLDGHPGLAVRGIDLVSEAPVVVGSTWAHDVGWDAFVTLLVP